MGRLERLQPLGRPIEGENSRSLLDEAINECATQPRSGAGLAVFADAIGAPTPRHVPVWLGRLFGGELGVTMMTELRGASNEKAKRELGRGLRYPSWRQGFRDGLD